MARAQAQIRALGTLLSPGVFQPPVTTTTSQMSMYVRALCSPATLPPASVFPAVLCGIDPAAPGVSVTPAAANVFSATPVSDARVALFTSFLSDEQLAAAGVTVPGSSRARFFNSLLSPGGSSLTGSLGSSGTVSVKIIGVVADTSDSYTVYLQIPDVEATGVATSGASRVLRFNSDQTIYALKIERPSFAKWGLFTNHQFIDQAAEDADDPIYFTERTNYSGPVHLNQNALFTLSDAVSSGGSTFTGGFGSAGCPAGQIVSASSIDPATGLSESVDSCGAAPENMSVGAYFNGTGSGNFDTPADMNAAGDGSTAVLPNVRGVKLNFGGNTPTWNDRFIALPANSISQSQAARNGGLYLSGTVDSVTLAMAPALNLGGVTVKAQTITYSRGGVTTELAYGQAGKMFIKVAGVWTAAAQTPCTPLCSGTQGEWAAATPATQGTFSGMIYAQNSLQNLSGPRRSDPNDPATAAPAVADFARLTVASSGDVNVTSDLKYESPPCSGGGVATAVCNNRSARNILGIYSAQGDVVIKSPTSDDGTANTPHTEKDVTIQAVLMASGGAVPGSTERKGRVRVDGYSSGRDLGSVNLLGGMIENYYGAFGTTGGSGYGRNIVYDERTNDGVAPPFFPTQREWVTQTKTVPAAGAAAVIRAIDLAGSLGQGKN